MDETGALMKKKEKEKKKQQQQKIAGLKEDTYPQLLKCLTKPEADKDQRGNDI